MQSVSVRPEDTSLTVHVVFIDADSQDPDPVWRGEAGRQLRVSLEQEGYALRPAATGEKSGDWYEVVRQIGQSISDNKEILSALISIAIPIVTYLLQPRSAPEAPSATEIELVLPDTTIPVRRYEQETPEQLLRRLLSEHPSLEQSVSAHRTMTITVKVAPRPPTEL